MSTKTKSKSGVERVVESAADAAEELGAAASAFKESWEHVRKARGKARPATKAATRAVKKVAGATKRLVVKVKLGHKTKASKKRSRRGKK